MPGLGASSVTLRDYPSGLNVVTFDIDPAPYRPYQVPIRGSSTKVLDGSVVHQFFGLKQADYLIELQGILTESATVEALFTKYRQAGSGAEFELRDWVENRFVVVFVPGAASFQPEPIPGAASAHTFSMTLAVISVLQLFGSSY